MIQDIEEESKTKFSMDVEFSFSFKVVRSLSKKQLQMNLSYDTI